MRMILFPCIVALGAAGPGCGPALNVTRTLIIEPLEYCNSADIIVERARNHKLAKDAWSKIVEAHPEHSYSADYSHGFKEGYADYLYAGGCGLPPPVPPRSYWKPQYESPEGYKAIEDWFAGFRHGAAEAQASGFRQYVTLPTSLPPHSADYPGTARVPSQPGTGPGADPPPELLPPPKREPGERQNAERPRAGGGQAGDAPATAPPVERH